MSIKGKNKTEAVYRANMLDSSSSLKDFSMDRKKYYKKYILGDKVDEKDNQSILMGKIVETLLLEPHEFDGKFHLSSCLSAPTGLMLKFVEALYKYAREATDEKGIVQRDFADISKDAYVDAEYKIPYDTVIKKFIGSDAEIYYREICMIRAKNLDVVTSSDVSFAERIVEELKNNFVTKDVVNMINSTRYTVLNQFQVEPYLVDGLALKSMIDKVIVDHEKKLIKIYDLKCTWSVENFLEDYYLYRRSYIQAYVYFQAIKQFTKNTEHEWFGYKVELPYFLVCDSTNYYNPLFYKLNDEDYKNAYKGFERKGKTYPGVEQIIEDLKWATSNNVWNISRTNFLNNGVVTINDL